MLVGSPEYFSTAGLPGHPDELTEHKFVGFVTPGMGSRFGYRFLVDGHARTMMFPSQLTVDDGEALVVAALQSVGLIMIVDYLVEDLIRTGQLVRVLRNFETPPMPVSVVHVPSRHPSPAARVLINMLRQRVRRSIVQPEQLSGKALSTSKP